jgi:2-dehydro-3-deoxyphosphogluconate aldolase/(4S)-4-hydroxy-2-oxoglutarate aldolase
MNEGRSASNLLASVSVLPVVVLQDATHAVPLAETLLRAGITAMEITLRTGAALSAIEAVATAVPEMLTGAGTVMQMAQMRSAQSAGARFAVSPGTTEELLASACVPYVPGAATASECMALQNAGYTLAKFFPAEALGGIATLQSLSGPMPDLRFCATGGIHAANASAYLALSNVACVGGSWFVPEDRVAAGDLRSIGRLAKQAAVLARA